MAEYIKREDALNAIRKSPISNMGTRLFCIDAIADIPAADIVERKHGNWKAASEDLIICTSCKCGFLLPYPNRIEEAKTVYGWNFCPNCGADMRGDDDV